MAHLPMMGRRSSSKAEAAPVSTVRAATRDGQVTAQHRDRFIRRRRGDQCVHLVLHFAGDEWQCGGDRGALFRIEAREHCLHLGRAIRLDRARGHRRSPRGWLCRLACALRVRRRPSGRAARLRLVPRHDLTRLPARLARYPAHQHREHLLQELSDDRRSQPSRPLVRVGIQLAMNVLEDRPEMVAVCERSNLAGIIRGPLAMGLLTGKYTASSTSLPLDDVRSERAPKWLQYFKDGKPHPDWLKKLDAVREILSSGGRTLAQGALAWLWARTERAIPIPGFRTVAQVEENCGAMAHGPLTPAQMREVDRLLDSHRPPAGTDR